MYDDNVLLDQEAGRRPPATRLMQSEDSMAETTHTSPQTSTAERSSAGVPERLWAERVGLLLIALGILALVLPSVQLISKLLRAILAAIDDVIAAVQPFLHAFFNYGVPLIAVGLIAFVAAGRRPARALIKMWGGRFGTLLICLGILDLVQPAVQDLFTQGFLVLLIGTLTFIISGYL